MTFADELKKIDSDRIRLEKETEVREKEKKIIAQRRKALINDIKAIMIYGRSEGLLQGKTLSGFFGYLPYRYSGSGCDNCFCFVPCYENDLQRKKGVDNSSFSTISYRTNLKFSMTDLLHRMTLYSDNKRYVSSEYIEDLSFAMNELGFHNSVINRIESTYYYGKEGLFLNKWEKRTTPVVMLKCDY